MARLQWQPIAYVDPSENAIRAQAQAGNAIQGAFAGLTGLLNQWEGDRREANLAELYARQNRFAAGNDVDGYRADLADGDLMRGLNYLKASDVAAARGYTNELRTARNADTEFERSGVRWDREGIRWDRDTKTYERTEAERELSNNVARTLLPLYNEAVASRDMTKFDAGVAALIEQNPGLTAPMIQSILSGRRDAKGEFRGDIAHEQGQWRFGVEQQNRAWTVEDRQNQMAAQAAVEGILDLGGNFSDLQATDEWKNANPQQRALMRQALEGRNPAIVGDAGGADAPAGTGGGLNGSYDQFVVALESSGNPNARAGTSSATGLHQFTTDTWLNVIKQHGFGWAAGKSDRELLSMRTDPAISRQVEAAHRADNARYLRSQGLPVNNVGLYSMHHFNPQTAVRFLKAGDDVRAERIFSQDALNANPYLKGKTKAEILANWDRRSGGSGRGYSGEATSVAVGAQIARSRDPNGPQARNIAAGLASDLPTAQVITNMMEAEGQNIFKGMDRGEVGRLIRRVQDTYADRTSGGRLPAEAAAQILMASAKPMNAVRDFWGNLTGRTTHVGSTGGLLPFHTDTIRWNDVNEQINQLMPDKEGQIPLVASVLNSDNLTAAAQGAETTNAALAAMKADLDARDAEDRRLGRYGTNRVTEERRARYNAAIAEMEAFLSGATGTVRAGLRGQ